jgi:thiol-disulfide isomerase/thioredoxin
LVFAVGLLWGSTAVTQTDIIRETRLAVAQDDFDRAETIVRGELDRRPENPRALEALSWVARGALAVDNLNLALTLARDTRRLTEEVLGGRSPDADPNLEIALGAAIEVQAQATASQGNLTDAIYLLELAAQQYEDTSVYTRLQKNIHLLSLVGSKAVPLDTSEFLGDVRAPLDMLEGGPRLLFFWAHWCPDCKTQASSIASLMDEFGNQGLQVVAPTQRYGYTKTRAMATGREEERAHISAVQREFYKFLTDVPMPLSEANFRNYGVSSTPTLVLVDDEGIVRLYNPGSLDEVTLREEVLDILK